MSNMCIYIGADHAGFELKEKLVAYLTELGHEIRDKGAFTHEEEDDYPEFSRAVAVDVAQDLGSKGIIIGGSGQGEAMVANRIERARAAVWYGGDKEILKLSREHNNANILCIGARFVSDDVLEDVKLWLETTFSEDERHIRRLSKFR